MQNPKSKIYLLLLTSSALSAVLCTFLAGLIIILNQFSFIEQYLQVPSSVSFTRMFLQWLDHTVISLIGDGVTQTIVVGLFWAVVGLGVYMFLRGVAQFISDIAAGADARTYYWPRGTDRNHALTEALERGMLRFVAFVGLVILLLGPLARLVRGPILIAVTEKSAVLKYALWFGVLWLVLHLCTVLIRLIVLKPRLMN